MNLLCMAYLLTEAEEAEETETPKKKKKKKEKQQEEELELEEAVAGPSEEVSTENRCV